MTQSNASTLKTIISIGFCLLVAGGVYLYLFQSNPVVHEGCVLTVREHDGEFGGHFFTATCGSATFTGIAAGTPYVCARVGDVVQVTTYDNYPGTITGDASC